MLSVFDGLRSVTTLSVFVRLACAFICGGIIGIERSYKRRPAGFRTHILICIGAAITTLTSQYLYLNFKYEVANELGVPLTDGYNGNLTSKQNGSVGGIYGQKK